MYCCGKLRQDDKDGDENWQLPKAAEARINPWRFPSRLTIQNGGLTDGLCRYDEPSHLLLYLSILFLVIYIYHLIN